MASGGRKGGGDQRLQPLPGIHAKDIIEPITTYIVVDQVDLKLMRRALAPPAVALDEIHRGVGLQLHTVTLTRTQATKCTSSREIIRLRSV